MSKITELRVFIDVNVALDLLLHRVPFFREASQILTLSHQKAIVVGMSAAAFPFAYFHLYKQTGDAVSARVALRKLSTVLELVAIDSEVVLTALDNELPEDLEDGVQLAAALAFRADMIVTRDRKGFRDASIPVFTPVDFLQYWQELDV